MSPILVTVTSCSDSDFESSNVSLKENKPDGVNQNSNYIDYYVRKNEGKILWFSADCVVIHGVPKRRTSLEKHSSALKSGKSQVLSGWTEYVVNLILTFHSPKLVET